MTDKEQIIINGRGCRYKAWDKDCALTGDNHGDNMEPCKFIDEKNCYYKQLLRKEQELIDYKKQFKAEIINKNEKIKELRFSVSDLTNRLCNLNAEKSFRIVDLEQALNEIEKYQKRNCETCSFYKTDKCGISCQTFVIIDIINKAKDGKNEQL